MQYNERRDTGQFRRRRVAAGMQESGTAVAGTRKQSEPSPLLRTAVPIKILTDNDGFPLRFAQCVVEARYESASRSWAKLERKKALRATFTKGEPSMRSIRSLFPSLAVATILFAIVTYGPAQVSQTQITAPATMPAQNSFCGSQPLCYETNDFAATITDFRTSTQSYLKIIDVIVRFQNKTNRPLILGYVANSGTAMDDRGNRYGVWGANGFRGIGQVYGPNNFDPKFNIPPGGFGDAQFELAWNPGQQVYGLTFELNLTVDEMNIVEGNQHVLGGEFPLHYRGLSNGVTGAAQGQSSAYSSQGQGTATSASALPPCGTTATSVANAATSSGVQVPASANNAVSNASAAYSTLGSLFKKKTAAAAPTAAPTTASAAPCAPATTTDGSSASTLMPVSGSAQPTTALTSPATGTMYSTTNGAATAAGNTAAPVTKAVATSTVQPAGSVKTAAPPTTVKASAPPATVRTAAPPATVKTAAAPPPAAVKKPVPPPPAPAKKPAAAN